MIKAQTHYGCKISLEKTNDTIMFQAKQGQVTHGGYIKGNEVIGDLSKLPRVIKDDIIKFAIMGGMYNVCR